MFLQVLFYKYSIIHVFDEYLNNTINNNTKHIFQSTPVYTNIMRMWYITIVHLTRHFDKMVLIEHKFLICLAL